MYDKRTTDDQHIALLNVLNYKQTVTARKPERILNTHANTSVNKHQVVS